MNEVTREKLTSDFKTLMDDVQELLKPRPTRPGESIADLRQRLGQKLEEARTGAHLRADRSAERDRHRVCAHSPRGQYVIHRLENALRSVGRAAPPSFVAIFCASARFAEPARILRLIVPCRD